VGREDRESEHVCKVSIARGAVSFLPSNFVKASLSHSVVYQATVAISRRLARSPSPSLRETGAAHHQAGGAPALCGKRCQNFESTGSPIPSLRSLGCPLVYEQPKLIA